MGATMGKRSGRCRWARLVARLRWQPDKWERLTIVADLIGSGADSVLDVGGRGHELAHLLAPTKVTSANVQRPADVLVSGRRLPFQDGAFDVVTSTDVLEHIAPDRRCAHLAEMTRVARHRLVLCCPWGSPEKERAESLLAERLDRELGVRLDFLDEHIRLGLPREADIRSMLLTHAPDADIRAVYQPGVAHGVDLVMSGMLALRRRSVRALLRFVWIGYVTRRVTLEPTASPDTSRVFLVVDLNP